MPGHEHKINGRWRIRYCSFTSSFISFLPAPRAPNSKTHPLSVSLHPPPPSRFPSSSARPPPSGPLSRPAPPISTPRRFPLPTNLSLGCGVRRALSPPPGGCSAVGEGALCMDGCRPPGMPLSVPRAQRLPRAALFRARKAVSAAVRAPSLPPRLLSSSLRASVCASAPPPPPRLRLPPLRASAPAGRTGSEARRSAGCLAGGGRGPSRGRRPGAGGGRPGLSAGLRDSAAERRREAETGGRGCGAGGGGGDSEPGRRVGD